MDRRYALTVPLRERHPLIQWARTNGVMLKDICAKLDVSRPTLHHWDKGSCTPAPRTAEKILALTNGTVTPNDLHTHWMSKQKDIAA